MFAAGDSTDASMDSITDFAADTTTGDVLDLNGTTVGVSIAAQDVEGVISGGEGTEVVTASTSATGIMTLAGAADIDTLAEWIDAAELCSPHYKLVMRLQM